jgi:hypothetical protein
MAGVKVSLRAISSAAVTRAGRTAGSIDFEDCTLPVASRVTRRATICGGIASAGSDKASSKGASKPARRGGTERSARAMPVVQFGFSGL